MIISGRKNREARWIKPPRLRVRLEKFGHEAWACVFLVTFLVAIFGGAWVHQALANQGHPMTFTIGTVLLLGVVALCLIGALAYTAAFAITPRRNYIPLRHMDRLVKLWGDPGARRIMKVYWYEITDMLDSLKVDSRQDDVEEYDYGKALPGSHKLANPEKRALAVRDIQEAEEQVIDFIEAKRGGIREITISAQPSLASTTK